MAISPQDKQLLVELTRSPYGKALKAFLEDELNTIGDITTCTTWEETLGRKLSIQTIKKLFYFMEEKKPTTTQKARYD